MQSIKRNEYAFATLAGGQGTRLGHSGPKGTYYLELSHPKSLFEIMCDSLKDAYNKYGVYIPWYILTSEDNHEDTVNFFESNGYFDYPKDHITFFKQGMLPMALEDGKIILESKGKIKFASDGHGGIFEAMFKNNIIEKMKKEGTKWCFIGAIDNVLLKMVDPLFLGLAISKNVNVASKSIIKSYPEEKVGVFAKRNGRPSVIEYTELPENLRYLCDDVGELVYKDAHILCNLFSIDALEALEKLRLNYHFAYKKSAYIDSMGVEHFPTLPNAYKFEMFMFDAFSFFNDMLIFRTVREEEFAPIKNAKDIDCPETAIKLYVKKNKIERN